MLINSPLLSTKTRSLHHKSLEDCQADHTEKNTHPLPTVEMKVAFITINPDMSINLNQMNHTEEFTSPM